MIYLTLWTLSLLDELPPFDSEVAYHKFGEMSTNSGKKWTQIRGNYQVGKQFRVLYSNQDQFETPGPVVERPAGSVEITEIDGGVSHGPVHLISVNVRPMEIQILGK